MTTAAELHAQAAVWIQHDWRFAVLLMEGEAPDRANGGQPRVDGLYSAVRARWLPMTTDPDQVPLHPVPGWRARIGETGTITVEWPHFTPLLSAAPISLPAGWLDAATEQGIVVVFAGHGLGLHEHSGDGQGHGSAHLLSAAADGALAGGAVVVAGFEETAARLDGTLGWPRHTRRHRPTGLDHRRVPSQRWWSGRLHHGPT